MRQFSGKGTSSVPINWLGKDASQDVVVDGVYDVYLLGVDQGEIKQQLIRITYLLFFQIIMIVIH